MRMSSVRSSQDTYKGVAVSVLVSVEPDLDVDLAAVQLLEGEARHLLPHGEGLADRLVDLRPADPAGGGITEDPGHDRQQLDFNITGKVKLASIFNVEVTEI